MKYLLVYTTYPNKTLGDEIAQEVILKGYAACANIIENITSVYSWKGKIQKEKEVVVLYKTTQDQYKLLETSLKSSHPYDCPCIIALEITDGNQNFFDWIKQNMANNER